ncbi:hypothetical protein HDU86_002149 [Geranomyces michiganensis]|nr:hypothetical protein HDU86_002149 [Geranomyces michiganensis]
MTIAIEISKCLTKLAGKTQKDRDAGTAELKMMISDAKKRVLLSDLEYRSIFTVVCDCVEKQKDDYVKLKGSIGSKSSAQSALTKAEKTLADLALTFKWLCESTSDHLEATINKPILEHVLQILPHQGGLFKPIALSYSRGLRVLLSRRASRNHIQPPVWDALVNLCISGLPVEDAENSRPKQLSPESLEVARIFALLVIGCRRSLAPCAEHLFTFLERFFLTYNEDSRCHVPLISAANHLLFEASHECPEVSRDFLATAVPSLIHIWETRGGASNAKSNVTFLFRFYLHLHDPCQEFDSKDFERNCRRLYDCALRELKSKLGVGCVRSMDAFGECVRREWTTASMLPLLKNTRPSALDSATHTSFAFLDWSADVFFNELYLNHVRNSNAEVVGDDGHRESRRALKRLKSDAGVMNDFDRIMNTNAGSRDEKIGLLQIFALMFVKHGHRFTQTDASGSFEADLSSSLAALGGKVKSFLQNVDSSAQNADPELTGWALICCATLPAEPVALHTPRSSVLDIALKLAGSNKSNKVSAAAAAAGFFYLENAIAQRLMPPDEIVKAFVHLGTRIDSLMPGACMIRFLLAYSKWSASGSRQSVKQNVIQCDAFEKLLRVRSAPVQSYMSIGLMLRYCAATASAFDINDTAKYTNGLMPADMPRTEECLAEWRLLSSQRLCKLAMKKDIYTLATLTGNDLPNTPLQKKLDFDPRLLRSLNDYACDLLTQWASLKELARSSKIDENHVLEPLICASTTVLLCGLLAARLAAIMTVAPSNLVEAKVMLDVIGKIAKHMAEVFPTMTEHETDYLFAELGEGFDELTSLVHFLNPARPYANFTSGSNGQEETESSIRNAASPLISILRTALRSPSADAELDDVHAMDEFDGPVTDSLGHASGGVQTVPTGGQLEFFFDPSALKGAEQERSFVLAYRCLGVLCRLLWPNDTGDHSDLWNEACETMMEMLPTFLDGITIRGDSVVAFLEFAAKRGLSATHCAAVIAVNVEQQRLYDSQYDPRAWTYAVRTLTAILPALEREREHEELVNEARPLVTRFFQYLDKRVAPWDTCVAIVQFIVQYLEVDPHQSLFELGGEEAVEWTMNQYLYHLLIQEAFLVRAAAVSAIPALFAIFPAADHAKMFCDIRDAPLAISDGVAISSLSFLELCSTTLALGEVVCSVPHQRVSAALQLLVVAVAAPENRNLVHEVFKFCAARLTMRGPDRLLDALLPPLFWAWEGDIDTFPIRLFLDVQEPNATEEELADKFLRQRLDLVLAKTLAQGNVAAAETLRSRLGSDATVLFRGVFVPVVAHLLPMLGSNDEQLTFLEGALGGKKALMHLIKASFPDVVAYVFKLGYDTNYAESLSDILPAICKRLVRQDQLGAIDIMNPAPQHTAFFNAVTILRSIEYLDSIGGQVRHRHQDSGGDQVSLYQSLEKILSPTPLRIILQDLHEEIESLAFAEDRLRLLVNGYRLLIAVAANSIAAEPFLFRTVLQQLLRCMGLRTLCSYAAGIFQFICEVTFERNAGIVGATVASVVPALAQVLVHHGIHETAVSEAVQKALEHALELAERSDSSAARLAVLQLDSSILGPALARKYETDLTRTMLGDPANALEVMVAGDPDSFAQIARAKYLRRALETTDMSIQLAGTVDTANLMVNHLLAMLQGAQATEDLILCVGQCLGRLAPLLRSRVSHDAEKSWTSGRRESTDNHYAGHLLALTCLQKYLFHDDVRTVGCVMKTLSALLTLPDGAAALKVLTEGGNGDLLQMFYLETSNDTGTGAALGALREYPGLMDERLWNALLLEKKDEGSQAQLSHEPLMCLANSLLKSYATSAFYANLGLVFECVPEFAELMLPHLVHGALEHEVNNGSSVIRKRRTETVRTLLSMRFGTLLQQAENLKPGILPTVLKIVELLRMRTHPNAATPFDNNGWLDLDYRVVSKAAALNSSYASALLFLEIAQEEIRGAWGLKLGTPRVKRSKDDSKIQDHESIFEPLLSIYQSMGDPDGFEGVMACLGSETSLDDDIALVRKYEHEARWGEILNIRETQLSVARGREEVERTAQVGLLRAMKNMGFHNILETYTREILRQNSGLASDVISEFQYECMWRNSRWDVTPDRAVDSKVGFNQQLYRCLKAYHERDDTALSSLLSSAVLDGVWELRGRSVHSALNPFPVLRTLTIMSEIEEMNAAAMSVGTLETTLRVWDLRLSNLVDSQNFADVEPVLAARSVTLRSLAEHPRTIGQVAHIATAALCNHLLAYSQIAREAKNLQMAQISVAQLTEILDGTTRCDAISTVDSRGLAKLEFLRILWAQDNQAVATHSLKHFLERHADVGLPSVRPSPLSKSVESQLLCQLGRWTADTRHEAPMNVMQMYFDPAIQAAAVANDPALQAKAHYHLARFADAQYEEMAANDPTDELREQIGYNERQYEACEHFIKQAVGVKPQVAQEYTSERNRIAAQIKLDSADVQRYVAAKDHFMERSVENYLAALELGRRDGDADTSVFRLCALWLANLSNPRVNLLVRRHVDGANFRSSAFLVPMYQLSARLSATPTDSERDFQDALMTLLYTVVRDHPHHALYQIIALKNGARAYTAPAASSTSRRGVAKGENLPDTAKAASRLLQQLRASGHPHGLGDLVERVDHLSEAYIALARRKIDKSSFINAKTREVELEPRSALAAMAEKGLDVPIATVEHAVREDRDYLSLPRVAGFDIVFSCPGGVNLPRRLNCWGTDGQLYTQLVKGGRDDLRQDAVLLKIFSVMNGLLRRNLATRKRNLSLRTYKVVPLAPTGGLVEWVHNTSPLLQCLVDTHQRYNPGDWKNTECRERMAALRNRQPEEKLRMYRQIESNFHPVFRHFFYEYFQDPVEWFEHRLAYTRSVAASSIAGYIVGLGDRHGSNILVDLGTAEVVHIDLGIAFDQGKVLPIPELVPFRLTRDVVDGMGIMGVEGAFRRSCEETIKVLREGSEVLLTILDVFRYDPLYTWKMTPEERRRRQGLISEKNPLELTRASDNSSASNPASNSKTPNHGRNKDAERALFAVRKRLSGAVSAECQISELIQAATDPAKLSRMYEGWQAWL